MRLKAKQVVVRLESGLLPPRVVVGAARGSEGAAGGSGLVSERRGEGPKALGWFYRNLNVLKKDLSRAVGL